MIKCRPGTERCVFRKRSRSLKLERTSNEEHGGRPGPKEGRPESTSHERRPWLQFFWTALAYNPEMYSVGRVRRLGNWDLGSEEKNAAFQSQGSDIS